MSKKILLFSLLSVICLTSCGNTANDVVFYTEEEIYNQISDIITEPFEITGSEESEYRMTWTAVLPDRNNLEFHIYNDKVDTGVHIDGAQIKNIENWQGTLTCDYTNIIIDANINTIRGRAYEYGMDVEYSPDQIYYMTFVIPDDSFFDKMSVLYMQVDELLGFQMQDVRNETDYETVYSKIRVSSSDITINTPDYSISSDSVRNIPDIYSEIKSSYEDAVLMNDVESDIVDSESSIL